MFEKICLRTHWISAEPTTTLVKILEIQSSLQLEAVIISYSFFICWNTVSPVSVERGLITQRLDAPIVFCTTIAQYILVAWDDVGGPTLGFVSVKP